ncbi:MAG TPA: NlpC/P60 family protein [Gemmatimonadales bacterium]|nr:NlpC/P60 family protein [Gemmatimonadales bacterium]
MAAVLTASMSVGVATASLGAPTHQDLVDAQGKLDSMNRNLSQLIEQYDQTNVKLKAAEQQLADAERSASLAQAESDRARSQLSARAAAAYEGAGTEIALLLGSQTFADFADQLTFLNAVAKSDTEIANLAQLKRVEATRAAAALTAAVQQHTQLLGTLAAKKKEIVAGIGVQQGLVKQLQIDLAKAAIKPKPPKPVPPPPSIGGGGTSGGGSGGGGSGGGGSGGGGGGGGGGGNPPSNPNAGAAVSAAYSAIGVPYTWGGASPETGFDCSGLTMWSWAHAGVSLDHSAAMQYGEIAHVSVSNLEPGDLLFFYTPISHVGLYIGNNQMIHASHPGTVVGIQPLDIYYWAVFVGAGRPGV